MKLNHRIVHQFICKKAQVIKGKTKCCFHHLTFISEIAYQTGFNDPKYFTRVFSAEFGVSPNRDEGGV